MPLIPFPVKYIIMVATVLGIVEGNVSTKCKNSNLKCYDCDNRYDTYCDIFFNQSLPAKPRLRECDGCCVTFLYTISNGGLWVQRSCIEKAVIDYSRGSIKENCLNKKMKAAKCFCESNFCNGPLPLQHSKDDEDSISTDRAPSLTSSPFYNNISTDTNHGSLVKMPTLMLFKGIVILMLIHSL